MSVTITPDFIKATIEKPNKRINCEDIGLSFYIKEFKGLGKLLVVAKKEDENEFDIKCFDWMDSMKFIF